MVFLHASPPTSSSTCCTDYARIISMKELDSSLAVLCNYSQSSSKIQRRQSVASCMGGMTTATLGTTTVTTFDVLSNQSSALITPPTTPDTTQVNALHRWSVSSISSTSSRSSTKMQLSSSSLYTNQQSNSSISSNLAFGEMSDRPNPVISTNTSAVFFDLAEVMRAATSTSATGPNVVPIDNKIEQAMDLVKTHLTFAVREEVEILRSTIVELEAKVAQLESQNQVLKQFAPVEVVNSLATLVQQQQQRQLQLQQQQLSSDATSPNPAHPIPVQNVSISNQSIQKQSMPTVTSEISVGPTSLPGVVPPVGLSSEVQPGMEQKQFPVTGSIVDSDIQ
uniref:TSC22 domain family protein 1 n=1 Tax=Onchocerca volvulus TaxID=6282 RepID=A0A8R1TSL3_ONCVO